MRSELFSTPTFHRSHSTAIIFAMKHSYIYGLLGLGLLCQLCGMAKAQQLPPAAPIPYYRDSTTGRLYWNKHIPLYVSLSPNADGSGGTVLQSHRTPQWGFPFYLDTEGVNYIRTRWAVDTATRRAVQPPTEILWEVYADGRPPESRIAVLPHVVLKDGRIAVNAEATATLTSRDAVSGVGATYYSLNGADYQPYSAPFAVPQEGECTIAYFAEDHVGNREALRTYQLLVDRSAPTTECILLGMVLTDNTVAKHTQIRLQPHDAYSGVKQTRYRLDSGAWVLYPPRTPIPLLKVPDGAHLLEFLSEDYVGNVEPVQQFRFYLDAIPPITISDVLGDRFVVGDKTFFSGRTKMKITAVDNRSGVKEVLYSVDGGPFEQYQEPFYMPNRPGWHTVRYYSLDSTENRTESRDNQQFLEYRMKVDKIYVDLSGPTISYSLTGETFTRNDTTFVSPRTTVTLRGSDAESGLNRLVYTIDNDAWEKSYSAPFDLQGLSSGFHRVEYIGYDNVENRNTKTFEVLVDNTPPTFGFELSVAPYQERKGADGEPVYPADAKVYLTAQDGLTGIRSLQYSLNGKPLTSYTKPFGGLERGKNRLLVRVEDLVGNVHEEMRFIEAY